MKYGWNLSLLCSDNNSWKKQYDKLSDKVIITIEKAEHLLDNIDLFLEFINDYIDINMKIEIDIFVQKLIDIYINKYF